MKELTPAARAYVTGIIMLAGVILVVRLHGLTFPQPWLFLTLLVLSSASAAWKITLPLTTNVSTMSVSYAVDFASLLMLGWDQTLLVAAASAFSQCVLNRKEQPPLHRTLFSMAALVVTVTGAGLVFTWLSSPGADAVTAVARPLVGAATAYFLLNTGLIAVAIALASKQRVFPLWQTNFLWSAPSYFVGAGTAWLAVWTMNRVGLWLAPLTFAPIYLTYRTYRVYLGRLEAQRHVQETSDLHLATIEALAAAIDAKDQMTRVHIRRVQAYAAGLAEALALPPGDVQAVRTAALLHDIGKLAIPAHILSKPGPLTPEEFAKVRIHPQIGAEIIASVPFPYPVAPIVLSHHERWDGGGYPQGLAGEAIPIGARILSLVDYFDVATSERPYHAAAPLDRTLAMLRHEAGRALDPALVELFIDRLPDFAARFDAANTALSVAGATARAMNPPDSTDAPNAFANIALAHQEIYALYEIAQTMGTSLSMSDTMELIASKLSAIVPWSGCALFVQDADSSDLRCRFALGLDAPRLLDARVRAGEGLAGWVARHRRSLVNAAPRIEFEAAGLDGTTTLNSAIVWPLEHNNHVVGALALYHVDAGRYTDDHGRLLARVAEQTAAVVGNSLVFEQTQEESLTDPLTGLPNRRSLASRLSNEIARAERLRGELAVIVLDVDGFKQINDTHGHSVGDLVLREIARTLLGSLRTYDMCVRYAGDEFVIVLGDCPPDAAELKRQELQRHIEDIEVLVDGKPVAVGASAGVAVFSYDGRTHDALLATADRRMYSDKALRRRFARGTSAQLPPDWDTTPTPHHAPRPTRPN